MAPIKFEEQIKDKLAQRTIQPSNDAWRQLSKRLDVDEKKKSRRLFFYVGIAASIVGILLVSNLMFNTSKDQSIIPTVVDTQPNKQQEAFPIAEMDNKSQTNVATIISEEPIKLEDQKETPLQVTSSIKNEQQVAAIAKQPALKEEDTKIGLKPNEKITLITEQAVATTTVNETGITQEIVKPANALTFEDVKALQVVAEIKKLEIENGSLTNTEIENLLKQAEKEILRHRIFNETTRTVDAEALLQDVEDELEQSFRTKVFEGLKLRSKTLLTAVSKRNN